MSTDLPKTYDPAAVEPKAYETWIAEGAFHADPVASGAPYSIVIPPPNVTGALHLGHAMNNTLQDILTRVHRMMGDNALWIPGIDHAGIATQAVVEKQLKELENKTRHDVGREGLVERIWKWKEQYGDRIISQLKRLGCSCDWDRTRFTLDEQCARAVRETFFKLFKDGLIYRGKRLVNWDVHLQTSISDDEIYHEKVKTNLWHIRYPIMGLATENTESTEKKSESCSSVSSVTSVAKPSFMTVATTRPETMLGDTAVAVHSEDPRWNWAIGKSVQLPLTGRLIPIIADDILVDPKFGTGVVKVTPAHDPNDYAVWQRHQGQPDQIDLINILNPDGTLNENAGAYKGMKRDAARKKVVEELTHQGLLEKEEPYETEVGHSDRSKTPVEPYLSDQWFVKMAPLAEPALEVVRNGTIKFFPERHAQQYLSWLGEKRDWPISRQLWWGHRIPVWTYQMSEKTVDLLNSGKSVKEASEADHAAHEALTSWLLFKKESIAVPPDRSPKQLTIQGKTATGFPWPRDGRLVICIRENPALEKEAESLGFIQDPDVLDTWFSSALWPHSTLGWPEQTPALAKWYPTSVLLTGRDIITLWVARMVMTGMYNMGTEKPTPSSGTPGEGRGGGLREQEALKPSPHPNPPPEYRRRGTEARALGIPFHHVAINPTILDGKGERMSKTKGNGVDPVDIIETHGADALRFTLCSMATETQDVRMIVQVICPHCGEKFANPESKEPLTKCPKCKKMMIRPIGPATGTADAPMARLTSEKFDFGRNFCNKLWNAARFVLSSITSDTGVSPVRAGSGTGETPVSQSMSLADQWIVSRFNQTVAEANTALSHYRFDQYAKSCYDFFWRDFCDWYVEASKPAMKDPKRAPQTAAILASLLDGALRLMHPVIPFITETIWWRLNEVRPNRGMPGLLECPPSPRLIKAAWPKTGPIDEGAEHVFPRLQDVIGVIRNLRNEHKVDQKKTVVVHLAPPEARAVEVTNENRELIENLATCVIKTVQMNLAQPPNTVRATINICEVYVEDLIDTNAEAARIAKRREELTKERSTLLGRLSNAGYIAKAPPHLVEQTKQRLAEIETELTKVGSA